MILDTLKHRNDIYILHANVCGDLWPLSLVMPHMGPTAGCHTTPIIQPKGMTKSYIRVFSSLSHSVYWVQSSEHHEVVFM